MFRELYSEKRVVLEERRARVDNSPLGKFLEEFQSRTHSSNYGRPVIGFESDIQNFGRQEVMDFFKRHYGPTNMTIAIVGDVYPDQVLLSRCFIHRCSFGIHYNQAEYTQQVKTNLCAFPSKQHAGKCIPK